MIIFILLKTERNVKFWWCSAVNTQYMVNQENAPWREGLWQQGNLLKTAEYFFLKVFSGLPDFQVQ